MQGKGNKRRGFSAILPWFVVVFALFGLYGLFWGGDAAGKSKEITQSQLFEQLEAGQIKNIEVQTKAGVYEVKGEYRNKQTQSEEKVQTSNKTEVTVFNNILGDDKSATHFITQVLPNDASLAHLVDAAADTHTPIKTIPQANTGIWLNFLYVFLPVALIVGFIVMMNRQGQAGGRNPMSIGKSNVKDQSKTSKVRFADVAGVEEEKQELVEIVEFLKNPSKYHRLGARIPKGVLLEGPPGTGKTLLAKAVAGEAHVPFFSISGSEFEEMFVGVGASRVRDLFDTAKKNSPSIIFIDEIDAVGRRRGNASTGGMDERAQTLNQLLVELDGFTEQDNVICIAATNRSDVLDPALMRPGRFDRQVLVGTPDIKGREAILDVHARNKRLAANVDLKALAKQTPGFTGAELENVLNEAALLAARLDKEEVEMVDIDEAQDRVIAGPAKHDRQVSEEERRMIAFHEAGHTVCGLVLSDARTVHKVTIVPRGRAGGYAIMLPREDQMTYNKENLREQIVGLLGGRAAEEVFFNTQTSGASNDFEQATQLARAMITQWGMNESLGPISYEGDFAMRGATPYRDKYYSQETAWLIDQELRKIMEKHLEEAKQILRDHREQVTLIAEKLLELETLDAKTIKSLFETGEMPVEVVEEKSEEQARPKTYEEVKADMKKATYKKQQHAKAVLEHSQNKKQGSPSTDEDNEQEKQNETDSSKSSSEKPKGSTEGEDGQASRVIHPGRDDEE